MSSEICKLFFAFFAPLLLRKSIHHAFSFVVFLRVLCGEWFCGSRFLLDSPSASSHRQCR